MKNEDTLTGGYNPFDWKPYTSHQYENGSWQETEDSFLFSFTSKNSRSGKIARVTNKIYAVEKDLIIKLSNDFAKLLVNGDGHDVIIEAGEGQKIKEFRAHSLILSARSTYFRAALSKDWARKKDGVIIFRKPNISSNIFEVLLKYLYTGNIDLDILQGSDLLRLLVAADELDLQKLNIYIQSYMIGKQSDYVQENAIKVLQTVFQHEICTVLKDFCVDVVCKEPKLLFDGSNFDSLDKSIFQIILQQDDLAMQELEIWNYLIKWGITRMDNKLDIEKSSQWTSENFEELEKILHDFIPCIRWFHIAPKDFWRKIKPFRKLLPEQLYEDIIGQNLDPETPPNTNNISPIRCPSFESCLIEEKHLALISSWIDKKPRNFYSFKTKPYNYELLYRASKEDFDVQRFHQLCDNKGPTLVISKIKYHNKLICGYNPLNLTPYGTGIDTWAEASDSFLSSFPILDSIHSAQISRAKDPKFSISYRTNHGPSFGAGWDLTIEGGKVIRCSLISSYPGISDFITAGTTLHLDDYEVFRVVRKGNK
ncbi:14024_t:CDS:2 [Funneliformis geosporum]|uniref:14024_t:CDS:1 n=1 Tax=Funneliformis geosporum TaxID=1117311 RepID=A0A9W4SAD9_9GLOM|nr:14024_t:CDS:2 [Funneliformis geosporum]